MLNRYVSPDLLDAVQEKICQETAQLFHGRYRGHFGIDTMVCGGLHPCVEINLRRTMGHVALALTPKDDELLRVMRIEYVQNNYLLTINRL